MWRPSSFWRRHTCKAAPHFDDTSGWTVVLAHYTIGSYGFCRDLITGKYILCWTFAAVAFVETSARLQSGYSSGSELSWESECQSAAVLKSICQYELEDGSHRETLFPVGHLQLYSHTPWITIQCSASDRSILLSAHRDQPMLWQTTALFTGCSSTDVCSGDVGEAL